MKTVSFPDILQLLATGKKTGILDISTSSRQKEVAFKDGNIIFASSVNTAEDLLGNMLLKKGRISKTDLDRAITLHKQTGRPLGTTLIDMNLFDKEEVADVLKMQIEEIVYNLFSWQEGDFIFHEGTSPKTAPFLLNLNTMNVIMEGTRRIDEWMEIQKVLPPDESVLALLSSPKVSRGEIVLSLEEFRVLALIDGEKTLSELIAVSPMGEFVTCRAVYRLMSGNLVDTCGRKDEEEVDQEDEEEVILSIVFTMYNSCFYRIRSLVETVLGGDNTSFAAFTAQYRQGLTAYFPGMDPGSDMAPTFDKFLAAVRAVPRITRYHALMSNLEIMLSDQLEHVFRLLGIGVFREVMGQVRREISEPLAQRRELVRRYGLESGFYDTLKRADRVVKMVRG